MLRFCRGDKTLGCFLIAVFCFWLGGLFVLFCFFFALRTYYELNSLPALSKLLQQLILLGMIGVLREFCGFKINLQMNAPVLPTKKQKSFTSIFLISITNCLKIEISRKIPCTILQIEL